MGDRISIGFKNKDEESVTFFSHWDGKSLLLACKQYLEELNTLIKKGKFISSPLARKEPQTIIVNFIQYFLKDKESVTRNYYLGKNKNDGDNLDNGHFVIDLEKDASQIDEFFKQI